MLQSCRAQQHHECDLLQTCVAPKNSQLCTLMLFLVPHFLQSNSRLASDFPPPLPLPLPLASPLSFPCMPSLRLRIALIGSASLTKTRSDQTLPPRCSCGVRVGCAASASRVCLG